MKTGTSIRTEPYIPGTNRAKPMAARLRTVRCSSLLLLLLALPATAWAQFDYTTNNGTITITEYTGSGGPVIIPGTINGLPVASLGSYYATQSSGVSVSWILTGAFEGSGITSIAIPSSLTNIPPAVLAACTNLSAITVDAANPAFSSAGGVLFDKSQAVLVQCPGGIAGTYTIPSSVTTIGGYSFAGCAALGGVMIPDSVTNIGGGAFGGCASLTNVTIGSGVVGIGDYAFSYCGSLAVIAVDSLNPAYSSVDGVLFDKSQTALIEYPGGKAGAYTIPSAVTGIGFGAFQSSSHVTSVTMGSSVTNIGESAFAFCSSLTNVIIGNGVGSIGVRAFQGCAGLTSVTIPDSVSSIGSSAFAGCMGLTNATLGSGVTTIGMSAFGDCTSLTTARLGSGVTSIGIGAFSGCVSLRGAYFSGDAPSPSNDFTVFGLDFDVTVYYSAGTTGWGLV
jgi:hypothetical protein